VWMIATMEPGMIGLMEPLETPSNQGLGEQVISPVSRALLERSSVPSESGRGER